MPDPVRAKRSSTFPWQVAALLALLALLLWVARDRGAAPPPDAPSDAPAQRDEPDDVTPVASLREQIPAEPEVTAAAALPPVDLAHPFEFALTVTLRGAFGAPVPDAQVFVAPASCGFSMWPERTGPGGDVTVRWSARERVMTVQVAAVAWGVLQPMRELLVEADTDARVAVAVEAREQSLEAQVAVAERSDFDRVRAAHRARSGRRDRDELDVLCGRTMLMFGAFHCLECHDASRVRGYHSIARSGTMGDGLHPHARFHDLRLRPVRGDELERRLEGLRERGALGDRSRRPAGGAVVRGRVRGRGSVVDVPVYWVDETGGVRAATRTGARGSFELGPLPAGGVRLVAGGGAAGIADEVVAVPREGVARWNPWLRPDRTVRGAVTGFGEEEQRGLRVELVRDEGDWAVVAHTDEHGRFVVHGVPGTVQCLVWPRGKAAPLPVLYGTYSLVDAAPVQIDLRPDVPIRARVRVHAVMPTNHEEDRVEARLVQLETGWVAPMQSFGFEDGFTAEPVAPGRYRVDMGAAGLGWVQSGETIVDGRGLWPVGHVHLPPPGRVRLREVGGAPSVLDGPHGFYRRTDAVDVRTEYRRRPGSDELELPAGQYVLLWQTMDGLAAVEFRVTSGLVTDVAIPSAR